MKLLGYRYGENKRIYFTDGYERENVVKYRNHVFLNEYFESELRGTDGLILQMQLF